MHEAERLFKFIEEKFEAEYDEVNHGLIALDNLKIKG